MPKRYYIEGRSLSAPAGNAAGHFGYIARKISHMQRMGIAAENFRGAACPTWLRTEIEKRERKA